MNIIKKSLSLLLLLTLFLTSVSSINANSASQSTPYGTLSGMTTMYRMPGSPAAKGCDVYTGIGSTVNYVGYSLSLKNNATGANLWSYSRGANNARTIGDSFDFNSSSTIYKVKTAAFGSHEVRHTYGYVVYTSSVY